MPAVGLVASAFGASAATAGAISAGAGALGSHIAGNRARAAARGATGRANRAQAEQLAIERERLDMDRESYETDQARYAELMERSREAYATFQRDFMPTFLRMQTEAGNVQADYEGVQNRATEDVNQAMDASEAARQRSLQRRGVGPDSGDQGRQTAIDRARLVAGARTAARTAETARVDNTRFSRLTAAANAGLPILNFAQNAPGAPRTTLDSTGMANVASGARAGASAATQASTAADQESREAWGEFGRSGAYDTIEGAVSGVLAPGGGNQADTFAGGSSTFDESAGAGFYEGAQVPHLPPPQQIPGYATGGPVNEGAIKARPGAPGQIRRVVGPGTGTSDSVRAVVGKKPIRVSNGEYIIPASVVDMVGEQFFDALRQMQGTAIARRH